MATSTRALLENFFMMGNGRKNLLPKYYSTFCGILQHHATLCCNPGMDCSQGLAWPEEGSAGPAQRCQSSNDY